MNTYLVKGIRHRLGCGEPEEIILGYIEWDSLYQTVTIHRPKETGHFWYKGHAYSYFILESMPQLKRADLEDFRLPTHQFELVVGKVYICRDGITARQIIRKTGSPSATIYWDQRDNCYTKHGTLIVPESLTVHHPQDLVREINLNG